jgi:Uma2 family endonuclease
MIRPITVEEYFRSSHYRPDVELIFGFLRRMPALSPEHLTFVDRVRAALEIHLHERQPGLVRMGPLDIVLITDEPFALVLHPALALVLDDRRDIMREPTMFWGAPHIVLEVLTSKTARRTRCNKMRWYRSYGVQECWCLDTRAQRVEVLDLQAGRALPYIYGRRAVVQSRVLPDFTLDVAKVYA